MKLGHKLPLALGLLTSLLAGSSRVVLFALCPHLSAAERMTLTQMAVGRSLFYRDERADDMWEELHVRSNTGMGRHAASH